MDNFYRDAYRDILRSLENLRKRSVEQWSDVLAYGGEIPPEVSAELATASRITGEVFAALPRYGVTISKSPVKPGIVQASIDGETFTCHESVIPTSVQTAAPVQPMPSLIPEPTVPTYEAPIYEQPVENFTHPVQPQLQPQPQAQPQFQPQMPVEPQVPVENNLDDDWGDDTAEEIPYDTPSQVPVQDFTEQPDNQDPYANFKPSIDFQTAVGENAGDEWGEDEWDDIQPTVSEPAMDFTPQENENVSFGSLTMFDSFLDEKSKDASSFVYESFVINATHSGLVGGGRAEEFRIMIAPLKIYPTAAASVPIIVALFHNNKVLIKSSYNNEDGNNSVMIDESEFYFLARGSFDGDGHFRAFFTTTGISATQGDIMNVVSRKTFGDNAGSRVGNGHLKVRASLYDEPGVIEVFPFGDVGENDFIIMSRTENFVEYSFIMPPNTKKYVVQGEKKKKNVVTCEWNDETLTLNLEEV